MVGGLGRIEGLILRLPRASATAFYIWTAVTAAFASSSDPCHPQPSPRPWTTVRSNQITVLINGYAESRIPLLLSIAASYASSPSVAAVLVLWGNPSTPVRTLSHLARNLTAADAAAPISVVRQSSDSLNSRFLPRPSSIDTRAVLICDDDVEIGPGSVEFAFRVWSSNPDRLVGFFARSHELDLGRKAWVYTVHPDRYSMVLTKFMLVKTDYLFQYSCGGGAAMAAMRRAVDQRRNCEDILMNFVVADKTGVGPVLVGAKEGIRDWGDARNDDVNVVGDGHGRRGLGEVGLSSRRASHRKRRGECIVEFHRALGRMPLRYAYGKVVDEVGEEALCHKGGKLVSCDH